MASAETCSKFSGKLHGQVVVYLFAASEHQDYLLVRGEMLKMFDLLLHCLTALFCFLMLYAKLWKLKAIIFTIILLLFILAKMFEVFKLLKPKNLSSVLCDSSPAYNSKSLCKLDMATLRYQLYMHGN